MRGREGFLEELPSSPHLGSGQQRLIWQQGLYGHFFPLGFGFSWSNLIRSHASIGHVLGVEQRSTQRYTLINTTVFREDRIVQEMDPWESLLIIFLEVELWLRHGL